MYFKRGFVHIEVIVVVILMVVIGVVVFVVSKGSDSRLVEQKTVETPVPSKTILGEPSKEWEVEYQEKTNRIKFTKGDKWFSFRYSPGSLQICGLSDGVVEFRDQNVDSHVPCENSTVRLVVQVVSGEDSGFPEPLFEEKIEVAGKEAIKRVYEQDTNIGIESGVIALDYSGDTILMEFHDHDYIDNNYIGHLVIDFPILTFEFAGVDKTCFDEKVKVEVEDVAGWKCIQDDSNNGSVVLENESVGRVYVSEFLASGGRPGCPETNPRLLLGTMHLGNYVDVFICDNAISGSDEYGYGYTQDVSYGNEKPLEQRFFTLIFSDVPKLINDFDQKEIDSYRKLLGAISLKN